MDPYYQDDVFPALFVGGCILVGAALVIAIIILEALS